MGGDPQSEDVFKAPVRLGALADRVFEWQARRSGPQAVYEIAGCQFDAAHCMWRTAQGAEMRLTEKERDVLVYLLGRDQHYGDRKDLLDHVWGYVQDVQTHTLETHIYRLRQKIEPDPAQPSVLVTERDGYRLLA
jgi:DNA-binding response OmpR family regulator